jgi:hypothetical protein
MPLLIRDCPRCRAAKMTFDVLGAVPAGTRNNWQQFYEVFSVCRACGRSTIFFIAQSPNVRFDDLPDRGEPMALKNATLNDYFEDQGYICLKDMGAQQPPANVSDPLIVKAFQEGAVSLATGCWNAAGAMFRLVIDLTTRPMLPDGDVEGLTKKVRRDLGLRLPWLFQNGKLPSDLRDLSTCVREDGNDGAHAGSLEKEDAEDLLDFTTALLERIFTEPERLRLAEERRAERRKPKD